MKLLHVLWFLMLSVQAFAVPARFHVFRARMTDGTYQNLRFCGDEDGSFYVNEDGFVVEKEASGLFRVTTSRLEERATFVTTRATKGGSGFSVAINPKGLKKIPVILANFSDVRFTVKDKNEEIADYYDKYCNGTGDGKLYTGAGSAGSVRDYFIQQSDSIFFPEFDVIGPVTLPENMAYYGKNSGSRIDVNFASFCQDALKSAIDSVPDFRHCYDNDGDGAVDLVFFIYAGLPESDPDVPDSAIWPKETTSPTRIGEVTVAVTACSSELMVGSTKSVPAGIGTMCHEVCHALGLPDEYDTNYKALGMSYWSLMDSGNYCDNGYTPCGLTAYERDLLGWRPLVGLKESTTVTLHPLEAGGVGYKIVNDTDSNEYYVLESRQRVGWDSMLTKLGHGMLVVHVDYKASDWTKNSLNTDTLHQRMSFIPANNRYVGPYNARSSADLLNALGGQPYPGTSENTALTDTTQPKATVFHGNSMGKPITQIREMPNGDIVLKFMAKGKLEVPEVEVSESGEPDNFTVSWNSVSNAASYVVEVYGCDGEDESTDGLVFRQDTVKVCSCKVTLPAIAFQKYAYRVAAQADDYEDSDFSEFKYVKGSAAAVREVKAEIGGRAEAYSLDGVLVAHSREEMSRLKPGIYILREDGKVTKVTVK